MTKTKPIIKKEKIKFNSNINLSLSKIKDNIKKYLQNREESAIVKKIIRKKKEKCIQCG